MPAESVTARREARRGGERERESVCDHGLRVLAESVIAPREARRGGGGEREDNRQTERVADLKA